MDDVKWNRLMNQARKMATESAERQKVVAVRFSDRTAKYTGSPWGYVINCGSQCRICNPE